MVNYAWVVEIVSREKTWPIIALSSGFIALVLGLADSQNPYLLENLWEPGQTFSFFKKSPDKISPPTFETISSSEPAFNQFQITVCPVANILSATVEAKTFDNQFTTKSEKMTSKFFQTISSGVEMITLGVEMIFSVVQMTFAIVEMIFSVVQMAMAIVKMALAAVQIAGSLVQIAGSFVKMTILCVEMTSAKSKIARPTGTLVCVKGLG